MNKKIKNYKNLTYLCFALTLIGYIIFGIFTEDIGVIMYNTFGIISIILGLVFILLSAKKFKLKNFNIKCPFVYVVFYSFIVCLCFILDAFTIIPYIHFMYYYNFVLVGYILLNIYSLLCLSK
jgi:hypothetical protein